MNKKNVSGVLFAVAFLLILMFPCVGKYVDQNFALSGVTQEVVLENANIKGVMGGTFQNSFNSYVENNFPGRNFLIKLRSQLRYTLLNESPNNNVILGKDKYLFEPNYITKELSIDVSQEDIVSGYISKLEQLDSLLKAQGKELYVFMTPNKAYFYRESIPFYYRVLEVDRSNEYKIWKELLGNSDLNVFDSREYIENYNGPVLDAPVFYPTGTHWSYPWGYSAAKGLAEMICENGKWDLCKLTLTEQESAGPVWPDADLYQSMNLFVAPDNTKYYTAVLSVAEEGERPNVFVRGGSFMGQSIIGLIQAGVFQKDVHCENHYYFTNRYTTQEILSSYIAYDEIDNIQEKLSETDIFILEVNEAVIGNMSFGFIEYLLEHPEYLEYPKN